MNSIEGEVRETIRQAIVDGSMLGSTYEDSAMTEEAYQKRFKLILNLHTDAILKLTNLPLVTKMGKSIEKMVRYVEPLSEKEVKNILLTYDKTIWECVISAYHDTGCWSGLWILLDTISKDITSHFSKPEIKYPETMKCFNCGCIDYEDHAISCKSKLEQKGYNQCINDTRKLNGEGGV